MESLVWIQMHSVWTLEFLPPLINLATIQSLLFIYCFLDFELQHSPLAKFICYVYALLKTPPKNPVGKKGRRKEYITSISLRCTCCLIKNLAWENPVGKNSSREKEYNSRYWVGTSESTRDLLDHDYGLWVPGLISPWTLQLSKSSHANSTNTSVEAGSRQRLCE